MSASFSPAWWLRGAHRQTLWGKFFRAGKPHDTRIERLETPDADFVDLHHLDGPYQAPLLFILHGLEGSVRSHYIQGLLTEARLRKWRAAVMIFRSCGGELNRAGLLPDEVVEVSRADLAAGRDPQLQRALQILGAR